MEPGDYIFYADRVYQIGEVSGGHTGSRDGGDIEPSRYRITVDRREVWLEDIDIEEATEEQIETYEEGGYEK